jgi:hypothetical protein
LIDTLFIYRQDGFCKQEVIDEIKKCYTYSPDCHGRDIHDNVQLWIRKKKIHLLLRLSEQGLPVLRRLP